MNDFGRLRKLVELAFSGIAAAVLGLSLLATCEPQAIVAGSGALVAAVGIFGLLAWLGCKRNAEGESDQPPPAKRQTRVFWLGVALTLAPGLLYFYLRYGMARFDPQAAVFLSVPVVAAGLGCIGLSFWPCDK